MSGNRASFRRARTPDARAGEREGGSGYPDGPTVMLFTALAAIAAGILFGIGPPGKSRGWIASMLSSEGGRAGSAGLGASSCAPDWLSGKWRWHWCCWWARDYFSAAWRRSKKSVPASSRRM